ncbi:cation:proton antiporter [Thiomicrorhabdus sp. 6S3-12]|uniref:cation:proton antiporter n=1 Tax=Thiomicrorhabdus sp. 6S3-12 TaxID=2819681 RepID=UPI001AAE0711|nr:cation:proton antiporter [Thiomicrorhabdus sp. 6S3-12]MBO1924814.1 cation:proton antiporter [Thiomicrorhabdus sp. 6S3-12]
MHQGNDSIALILLTFGGLFIIGLIADLLGRHTPLPRVTLLILTGFVIGPSALNWLPPFIQDWFPILTNIALSIIGFELGKNLTKQKLTTMGRPILGISLSVMFMTALLMFAGLYLLGVPIEIALILAGIAPATAPAPVVDVVSELNAKGSYTDTLLGIVAIDDAWGMLLFSLLLVVAAISTGNGDAYSSLHDGLWEIFGAVLLGLLLGFPMAFIGSHIYPGKATQAEALGIVLLCAGAALYLEVSYILSAMVMGTIVANFSQNHQERPFEELEAIQWPLLILFFLLAGSSLHLQSLWQAGLIGFAYLILRIFGRLSGSWIGATWAGCRNPNYHWMGLAMLPHAGVPIGMTLLAAQHFPEHEKHLLAVILGVTVIFELIGPAITRHMIRQAGEAKLMPYK